MKQQITAWKTTVHRRQLSWMQAWNARTERERHFLLGAAIAIAATLFYLVLIAPAMDGRSHLQRTLPQLRMQAAQLQALAHDAAALPAAAVSPAPSSMPSRQKIESALRQHGLKAQSVSIAGDGVRLQFEDAPFAQLLECLLTLQKTQQLEVADAGFSPRDKPGMVNATLQLNRRRNE